MFIKALFTITKLWKQPKCLWTDEWIKKMWYIYMCIYTHTMIYYSAIKKEWNLAICNNMDGAREYNASEISQRKTNTIWFHSYGEFIFIFLKILFIYLTGREIASERGNTSRGSGRGRSMVIAEEPDVGLDPRTLGSWSETRADA